MAKRILVPLKSTEPTASFVEALVGLARSTGATVRLLHVGPLHDHIETTTGVSSPTPIRRRADSRPRPATSCR